MTSLSLCHPTARCQSRCPALDPGPTAFVLAGGGTKGSFEVGVLQYLVGVEGIVPDVITATSAGAIAATVLAQARTLPEFLERVDEIEGDVLAWTQTDHVFGKQAWLEALDGTALGPRDPPGDHRGHPPALPPDPLDRAAGNEVVPADTSDRKGSAARPGGPGAGASGTSLDWWPGPGSGCPGSGATSAPAAARSSTSTLWPVRSATGARTGSRAVDPDLIARPACGCAWPSPRSGPGSCAS